uniref:CAP-Gly domain-containing protein n=1 Tax=Branchiostoma floridae TaxID=7739 RepID=C3ZEY6_BRAFL|eukprot:XP_002593281.1 hypothetical protein BRAFLDRAFT_83826 [Branchiostoma floridae]
MVLFINVHVGQRVEVLYHGTIEHGTVRYTGHLNGMRGNWVGVEFDFQVGKHNGTFLGRHYFSCKDGHGVFLHASRLRFESTMGRWTHDPYRTVSPVSEYDPLLFGEREHVIFVVDLTGPRTRRPASVTRSYKDQAVEAFPGVHSMFSSPRSYHLSHSVGNHIPAATMRPQSAMSAFSYTSSPVHEEYDPYERQFISSPTIPKTHMPHSAQIGMARRGGWERYGLSLPRELTYY